MPKQRLYIDESGDHSLRGTKTSQWDKSYLCLFGCSLEFEYCLGEFTQNLNKLKADHFGADMDEPVILHREEICAKVGIFSGLKNSQKCRKYQEDMLGFIAATRFRAFAVVIDKHSTQNRHYGLEDANPYHISLAVMLERYCGWLSFSRQTGDTLAESRGGREDKQLKAAYQAVCSGGTRFRKPEFFKQTLTTAEIKIKPKVMNILGLQLADQIAYAAKRRILEEKVGAKPLTGFEKEVADTVEAKFNSHYYDGRKYGYGKIFLT